MPGMRRARSAQARFGDDARDRIGIGGDIGGATRKPVTPSSTRSTAPVARAATTGTPAAIASEVTLPNVSVTLGLKNTSIDATARPRSSPLWKPANTASGTRSREPVARRAFADHQHAVRHAAPVELVRSRRRRRRGPFPSPAGRESRSRPRRRRCRASAAIRGCARSGLKRSWSTPRDQMRDRRRHAPARAAARPSTGAGDDDLVDAVVEARQQPDQQRLEEADADNSADRSRTACGTRRRRRCRCAAPRSARGGRGIRAPRHGRYWARTPPGRARICAGRPRAELDIRRARPASASPAR